MPSERPRVLAVDDDPDLLRAVRATLSEHVDFTSAPDAESAVRLLRVEDPFAVIVSDMELPGMSGVDFLRAAREIVPSSVAILLSGRADLHTAGRAVNEGNIFRFLTKPCQPELLIRAVDEAVREHQRLTQLKTALTTERARIVSRMSNTVQLAHIGSVVARQRDTAQTQLHELRAQLRRLAEKAEGGGVVTDLNLRHLGSTARRLNTTLSPLFDVRLACRDLDEIDLRNLTSAVVDRVRAMEGAALIEVAMPGSPCVVWARPFNVAEALTHLLRNGVEAAGGSPDARVEVELFENDERAGVIVRDNGPGVHPEISPHLFNAFFSTRGRDRPGLGLTLARGYLRAVGGQIRFTSDHGDGATFRIELPRYQADAPTQRDR